jgi:uncharacterized protein (DUF302 family)
MQADPRVGIELPLRLLIWAEGGRTRVGYRDPRQLAVASASASAAAVLEKLHALLARLVREAAGSG